MKTSIGSEFSTGQECPESGVYTLVRHMDGSHCPRAGNTIPLAKGNKFPPDSNCNKGAIWRLSRYA